MAIPAVDMEGSGALTYLRSEVMEQRAICFVIPTWPPYVADKCFVVVHKNIAPVEFDARQNLVTVTTSIRALDKPSPAAGISAAEAALLRLNGRQNESIEGWAEALSNDLTQHND